MRWLVVVLAVLLLGLQIRLWYGEGSLAQRAELRREVKQQQVRNDRLVERNRILDEEVDALKHGLDAIEERARADLGMIKEKETFYLVVDEPVRQQAAPPVRQSGQPLQDAAEGQLPGDLEGQAPAETGDQP